MNELSSFDGPGCRDWITPPVNNVDGALCELD